MIITIILAIIALILIMLPVVWLFFSIIVAFNAAKRERFRLAKTGEYKPVYMLMNIIYGPLYLLRILII